MRGVTKNLLKYRAGKQMWTLSTQKPQWCYPTFGGCRSLSEESRHPFVLGRVFVHSELYLTFLFTWKSLCHLTRERELCIGSLVLTVTYVGQTEYWYICSQPHPMNRESGLLPQVYDLLVKPSVTPDSAIWPHLPFLSILCVVSWVTVSLIISHLIPNYHPISCHTSVLKQVFVTPLISLMMTAV